MVSFFFFSSRRRHTRSKRDWSSDVCSSDLVVKSRAALISPRDRLPRGCVAWAACWCRWCRERCAGRPTSLRHWMRAVTASPTRPPCCMRDGSVCWIGWCYWLSPSSQRWPIGSYSECPSYRLWSLRHFLIERAPIAKIGNLGEIGLHPRAEAGNQLEASAGKEDHANIILGDNGFELRGRQVAALNAHE